MANPALQGLFETNNLAQNLLGTCIFPGNHVQRMPDKSVNRLCSTDIVIL